MAFVCVEEPFTALPASITGCYSNLLSTSRSASLHQGKYRLQTITSIKSSEPVREWPKVTGLMGTLNHVFLYLGVTN